MLARSITSIVVLTLLTLTTACGGGDTPSAPATPTPPPPAPPPPPPPTAARLSAHTGADQTGEPRTATSTRPSVVVRSASGVAVAGVSVVFSVDSGGGQLTEATVLTGSDGVATVGSWVLGPNEGRHVLLARADTMASVRFVATAVVEPRSVAGETITSGTLAVSGGPLAGARLEIPVGAFDQAARWTLEQRSGAAWPTARGVHPVGAAMRITRDLGGASTIPMRLTLPARVPAGTKPFVLVRDPVSGAVHVLPTVDVDSVSVTVAAFHFNPTVIAASAAQGATLAATLRSRSSTSATTVGVFGRAESPFAHGASAMAPYDVEVVVSAIPEAELDKDQMSNYLPGRDDWDIRPLPQAIERLTARSRMPEGLVVTSMVRRSYPDLPSLHGLHRQIPLIPSSNRVAFHAGAQAGERLANEYIEIAKSLRNASRASMVDQLSHDWLRAALFVTGLPQMAFAVVTDEEWAPLVAYAAVGGQVKFANPWRPGDASLNVAFSGGRFGPLDVVTAYQDGAEVSGRAAWFSAVALMHLASSREVALELLTWETGKYVPAANEWILSQEALDAQVKVKARGGFVEDTILYMTDDTTRIWVECAVCKPQLLASELSATGVAPFAAYGDRDGVLINLGSTSPEGKLLEQTTSLNKRVGFVSTTLYKGTSRWLNFQWVRFKRWILEPRAPDAWAFDEPSTWTVTIDGPTLPPNRVRWTFGPESAPIERTTVASTVDVTLTTAQMVDDKIPLRVELLRNGDDSVLSRREVRAEKPKPLTWRLTSFTLTGGDPLSDAGLSMIVPEAANEWVLFVFLKASAQTVGVSVPGAYLQRILPGEPVVFNRAHYSVMAMANRDLDPERNAVGAFNWTGTSASGTLDGRGTPGRFSCGPTPGSGSRQFFRTINALKTAEAITGTLTSRIERSASCPGGASADMQTASFTALRIP